MLALPTTPLGVPVLPIPHAGAGRAASPFPGTRAFLRSVMPALDLAFGLEDVSTYPDAIVALIERLEAGPLGQAATAADRPAVAFA
ncbi:hypothetical protein MMB17_17275 [Methylobacterium organophilum]|uniref:hypothetical protein n=1 Tax=Methylobacterium organophilum TaxID=410 RepID=UPI001F131363|nr:hypothetical protein [Methylobacterium organophilum]UMY16443.1 hypothetical protein MMB17_17275 [Methylobacterium organophilum]